jgi:uncharacterized protein (DUF427 family)
MMTASGPLGRSPAGSFNFEPPAPGKAMYIEPSPKRVRVEVAGETIADSRAVTLVSESGLQPVYYFPPEDVRAEVLEPSERHTTCPKKGEASYHTIRVGDHVVENGAWYYPDPLPGAKPLAGLIAFYFNRMDRWYEEDEEVFVHPRDPYHRVDVLHTDRHVRVSLNGEALAESRRAVALFETSLPTRWYLPLEDVSATLLDSEKVTRCPYKGEAGYHSVQLAGGEVEADLIWVYAQPLPEVAKIAGRLCFFNERVDIELDGELQERPESPWRPGAGVPTAPVAETRG